MNKPENYNLLWLQGYDMTDQDYAEEIGVDVPNNLFGTPEFNEFLLDKFYRENIDSHREIINPKTGDNYTPEEAEEVAARIRANAQANIDRLIKEFK